MRATSIIFALCSVLFSAHFVTPSSIDLGIGLCGVKRIPCQCGSPSGYTFHLELKECSAFHKWRHYCRVCDDVDEDTVCEKYLHCLDCDDKQDGCHKCPLNRYGRWCQLECTCQNGGSCDEEGKCRCTEEFFGTNCEAIAVTSCPSLPTPEHGFVNAPLNPIAGTKISFTCDVGYVLSGSVSRICQDDGSWSESQPKCELLPHCPRPAVGDNNNLLDFIEQGPFPAGSSIFFKCREGFLMSGQERVMCESTGHWSHAPPICNRKEITCPNLGTLANGKVHVVDGREEIIEMKQGTRLQFSCDPAHVLEGSGSATCQENGEWNTTMPSCIKVATCPAPADLQNGVARIVMPNTATSGRQFNMSRRIGSGVRLLPRVSTTELKNANLEEGFYPEGTQAIFECESKYYELKGSQMKTCMADGKWSGRPSTCIPVCGHANNPRNPTVTHGIPSAVGQWPWMVGISRKTSDGKYELHCGASLISERYVVTAAHCVTFEQQTTTIPADELRLFLGKYYRDTSLDDEEVQSKMADSVHVHPDYDPRILDSDIALIRMEQPVRLSNRIQPVCLPSSNPVDSLERLRDGRRGVVIGWGQTENGTWSQTLLQTEIPVVPTEKCIAAYKLANTTIQITSNMFCAGKDEGQNDACNGDSGGPLVFPAEEGKPIHILEGVTSWGSPNGCGLASQYGGFVRVQNFVDWMSHFL